MERVVELLKNSSYPLSTKTIARRLNLTKSSVTYLVNNNNDSRNIKLSEKTMKFKTNLIQDQKRRLDEKSLDCEIIDIGNLKTIENSYFLYPCVGENLDFLTSQGINNIRFLYRNLDQSSWKYCNKGFFNFKKYIPTIIKEFF